MPSSLHWWTTDRDERCLPTMARRCSRLRHLTCHSRNPALPKPESTEGQGWTAWGQPLGMRELQAGCSGLESGIDGRLAGRNCSRFWKQGAPNRCCLQWQTRPYPHGSLTTIAWWRNRRPAPAGHPSPAPWVGWRELSGGSGTLRLGSGMARGRANTGDKMMTLVASAAGQRRRLYATTPMRCAPGRRPAPVRQHSARTPSSEGLGGHLLLTQLPVGACPSTRPALSRQSPVPPGPGAAGGEADPSGDGSAPDASYLRSRIAFCETLCDWPRRERASSSGYTGVPVG